MADQNKETTYDLWPNVFFMTCVGLKWPIENFLILWLFGFETEFRGPSICV